MKVRIVFEVEVANEQEARDWTDKMSMGVYGLEGVPSPDEYWFEFVTDEDEEA